jgi:hypothetical protein
VNPWRRTTAMLLAALAVTVALGLPARASEPDRTARTGAPQVVHSGPECFAGATAEQVSRTKGD